MNFALGKISKPEFLTEMNLNEDEFERYVLDSLQRAYDAKDSDTIEYTFHLGYDLSSSERFVIILCKLLVADWHMMHEDIARRLQDFKSPDSIDCLYEAILKANKLAYLEYNEGEAFIIKCCYALNDINTTYSHEKLKELAKSESPIIQKAALHQIKKW